MSLNLKGLVKKVYRAFKMSVGVFVGFSFVALYAYAYSTVCSGKLREQGRECSRSRVAGPVLFM